MSEVNDKSKIPCMICHRECLVDSVLLVKNDRTDYIFCCNCIDKLNETRKTLNNKPGITDIELMSLHKMVNRLKSEVFGQDAAVQQLAAIFYCHFARLKADDKRHFKTNTLIIGPTGSGKTMAVELLAEMNDVPFVQIDSTTLTEAGFVGHDVSVYISQLLKKTNNDVAKAERAVVFVDEIDKIRRKETNSTSSTVNTLGVQHAWLTHLQGIEVYVEDAKNPTNPITVRTHNILFIFGGAFSGLEDYISERTGGSQFSYKPNLTTHQSVQYKDTMAKLTSADLERFGMIPELIGRLPNIIQFDPLTDEALTLIIHRVFREYAEHVGKYVTFNLADGTVQAVLQQVKEQKTGARAVNNVIWNIVKNSIFQIADNYDNRVLVNIVMENNKPIIGSIQIDTLNLGNINSNELITFIVLWIATVNVQAALS
jgi:ATP-dependent Clp protease ATP-binding subunit ClpX